MKKEEVLRIGNTVSIHKGFEVNVVGVFKDTVYLDFENNEGGILEYDTKDIDFIPITEDLIKRCKFEFKNKKETQDLSVSIGLTTKDVHFCIGNFYLKIEYLHELQNLYIDFMKKPLVILKQK